MYLLRWCKWCITCKSEIFNNSFPIWHQCCTSGKPVEFIVLSFSLSERLAVAVECTLLALLQSAFWIIRYFTYDEHAYSIHFAKSKLVPVGTLERSLASIQCASGYSNSLLVVVFGCDMPIILGLFSNEMIPHLQILANTCCCGQPIYEFNEISEKTEERHVHKRIVVFSAGKAYFGDGSECYCPDFCLLSVQSVKWCFPIRRVNMVHPVQGSYTSS